MLSRGSTLLSKLWRSECVCITAFDVFLRRWLAQASNDVSLPTVIRAREFLLSDLWLWHCVYERRNRQLRKPERNNPREEGLALNLRRKAGENASVISEPFVGGPGCGSCCGVEKQNKKRTHV